MITGSGEDPPCAANGCITCGDTAVVVTVVKLLPDGLAVVDTGAGREEISVALVDAVVGTSVLAHAGEAIAVIEDQP
ncbi:HypC/HybG/HupF family hydrogenase formation chaperone [Kutzneria sp. CA-103260]|uniref:HypC/HybG/HupF family hydrogenase formation chaperone n=1 Tax=Kutzneria sp. CA-103260 TaxID=2802641 RepID=UPI001BAAB3AF|nr:HypC/HybG/HupF family hydrogenase formation chaperone [Kutzneria sp. CA-103260]QUQ64937.1 HupF/HypC family protein [Kutzneria sp. CA-103260]